MGGVPPSEHFRKHLIKYPIHVSNSLMVRVFSIARDMCVISEGFIVL